MNMFKEQAAAKKASMEALKAEVTTGKTSKEGTGAHKTKASKSSSGRGGSRRKSVAKIVEEQERGSRRRPAKQHKGASKPVEEPSAPQKEKITRRTSFSFTDSEYERLNHWAHEHYTTMKGAIFLAMDLADAASEDD